MLIRLSLAIVTLLFACSFAGAEMYQWVDDKGVVTFKDYPPPASKKKKKIKTYSDSDFDPAPVNQPAPKSYDAKRPASSSQATTASSRRFDGVVEIYLTDWCGYCKKAKKYMDSNGIRYQAYDIEKDSAAKRRFDDLGGGGVPLIIIGSQRMSGFSPEALEQYLGK